jgi:hypothetical protein
MDWVDYVRDQAKEETARLLREGNVEVIISTSVQRLLQAMEGFVDAISNNVTIERASDFNVALLLRCVAKKSQESLKAIVELTEHSQAYYAMPLLRPMCEELIFIRFMKSLPRSDADAYLYDKVMLDIYEGLEAQRDFFNTVQREYPDHIRKMYEPHHGEALDMPTLIREKRERLKDIGRKLGWAKGRAPKVKDMAESTGLQGEYAFFYHATSSAVHANVHYIWRMVAGNPHTGMTISNKNFDKYYRHFVLTYGAWLTTAIVDEVAGEFTEQWYEAAEDASADYDTWRDLVKFIVGATRFPPIVTEVELRWPGGIDG